MNKKGQGALEYLLLLVAALFIVAIVFVFINSTIAPTQDTGSASTFDFLCSPPPRGLDSQTNDCACYLNDSDRFTGTAEHNTLNGYCCSSERNSFLRERYEVLSESTC